MNLFNCSPYLLRKVGHNVFFEDFFVPLSRFRLQVYCTGLLLIIRQ